MATVHLPRLLDPATGGRRTVEVRGATIGEVVASLLVEMPGLESHLFDGRRVLRPHVLCFVDGDATRLEDPSRDIDPQTEIRFLQAVSGGAAHAAAAASRVGRLNTNQRA